MITVTHAQIVIILTGQIKKVSDPSIPPAKNPKYQDNKYKRSLLCMHRGGKGVEGGRESQAKMKNKNLQSQKEADTTFTFNGDLQS